MSNPYERILGPVGRDSGMRQSGAAHPSDRRLGERAPSQSARFKDFAEYLKRNEPLDPQDIQIVKDRIRESLTTPIQANDWRRACYLDPDCICDTCVLKRAAESMEERNK